jgi:hypothetical protein
LGWGYYHNGVRNRYGFTLIGCQQNGTNQAKADAPANKDTSHLKKKDQDFGLAKKRSVNAVRTQVLVKPGSA